MPQRVRDVFAWLRLFMSTQGPPATTRLVLFAHSLFMDRDGSHCRVGVRRLADITGLDKTTVAQHRAAAIKLGWLMGSKPPRGQGSGEIFAAAPDGVRGTDSGTVSSDAGQANAGPREVSGLTGATVRSKPANRPSGPDVPSLPLTPLERKLDAIRKGGSTEMRNPQNYAAESQGSSTKLDAKGSNGRQVLADARRGGDRKADAGAAEVVQLRGDDSDLDR
jgi:hypothetical protein